MKNTEIQATHEIYCQRLNVIDGIKFTYREIDVIACLVHNRSASIPSLLHIAQRAVEANIRNITLKLRCNTRDGIIDFIEKSNKYSDVKNYYLSLLIRYNFEKELKNIFSFNKKTFPPCLIVAWPKESKIFLRQLKKDLQLAGIAVELTIKKEPTSLMDMNSTKSEQHSAVYLIPKELMERGNVHSDLEIKEKKTAPSKKKSWPLFILLSRGNQEIRSRRELVGMNFIDLTGQNYYLLIFEILKNLLPQINLEKIAASFYKIDEKIISSQLIQNHLAETTLDVKENKKNYKKIFVSQLSSRHYLSILFVFSIICIGGLYLKGSEGEAENQKQEQTNTGTHDTTLSQKHPEQRFVLSDLNMPTESTFLNRPELIAQIDAKLKAHNGIQSIALIGPGGAGKTTIARQYARQQKAPIIWEINAESQAKIIKSFENQAYIFAKTEEEKENLREIEEIKEVTKREERIIQFVKGHLKSLPDWLLIFDNVNEFIDIQQYFPQTPLTWGRGKVILTTRDANIQNNTYINNSIIVEELSPEQKFHLFTKIITHGNMDPLTPNQEAEAKLFLKKLPSFPLDIVIAASYFRSTNISFNKYIELISKSTLDFVNFEKTLMRSIGDYAQTRQGIITLSLENIINEDEDFKKLLFFISLIGNYEIPTVILELIVNKETVDNFLYQLNRYSLITNTNFIDSLNVFSIHDHTHDIIKNFMKKTREFKDKISLVKFFASLMRDRMYATSYEETNLPQTKLLLNHCVKFLNNSEIPPGELKQDIAAEMGRAYFYLGEFSRAKSFLEESFLMYQKRKKEDVGRVGNLRSLSFIGDFYGHAMLTGDVEIDLDKLQHLADVLEEEINKFPKETFQNFLGEAYQHLSLIYQFVAQIKNENKIWENIAKICNQCDAGDKLATFDPYFLDPDLEKIYKKAYYLAQRGLNIVLVEDKNHTREGSCYLYISVLSNFLKKDEKVREGAKKMGERGNEIYKKLYTHDNIRTGWSSMMLASLYSNLGLYEKASSLYNKGISIYKQHYGLSHSKILMFENEIAYNLILLRKFNEAEKILTENLNKSNFSSNINIKKTIHLLVFLYQKMIDNNQEVSKSKILKSHYTALLCKKLQTFPKLQYINKEIIPTPNLN